MKRIFFLTIIVFTAGIMISCNDSSNGSTTEGYINPKLGEAKTQAIKSYTFSNVSLPDCSSGKACGAVIYRDKLDHVDYTGFAVGKDTANPEFTLKIYWTASSIPTSVNFPPASYSIIINDGTYTYSTKTANLIATIASGTDSNSVAIYNITFTGDIAVSDGAGHTVNITDGDTITAYKYPEETTE